MKEYYNKTYSQLFHSAMADLMIKRIPETFTKDHLIDADLACYYIGELNNIRWFPITYIYRREQKLSLFSRLISMKHFEKVKNLLNITTTPKELQDKLKKIKENDKHPYRTSYSGSFEHVKPVYEIIDIEKIGTIR